jgi:hypothetical protein
MGWFAGGRGQAGFGARYWESCRRLSDEPPTWVDRALDCWINSKQAIQLRD